METTPSVRVGPKATAEGREAVCSSAHPLVTDAMLDILREGGNAIDAAIAGSLLNATIQQDMTGHAGTVTMLFWNADQGRCRSGRSRSRPGRTPRSPRGPARSSPTSCRASRRCTNGSGRGPGTGSARRRSTGPKWGVADLRVCMAASAGCVRGERAHRASPVPRLDQGGVVAASSARSPRLPPSRCVRMGFSLSCRQVLAPPTSCAARPNRRARTATVRGPPHPWRGRARKGAATGQAARAGREENAVASPWITVLVSPLMPTGMSPATVMRCRRRGWSS